MKTIVLSTPEFSDFTRYITSFLHSTYERLRDYLMEWYYHKVGSNGETTTTVPETEGDKTSSNKPVETRDN